jgi:hypothetical protein
MALLGIGGLAFGYAGWAPAIWGVVLLACVLFERRRYKTPSAAEGRNWQRTGEQFIDPESGQATEVFYDPDTGERRYATLPSSEK